MKAVVATLKKVVSQVVQDSGYRAFFARQYLGLVNEDGDAFRQALDREYAFYSDIVGTLQLAKTK